MIDFVVCEIDDIVEAVWNLFLEYLALKNNIKSTDLSVEEYQQIVNDYNSKKTIVKKILSCNELDELMTEKGACVYFEDRGISLK